MRVFVSGVSGRIGSYIIPELIAVGHEVTGLTRSDKAAVVSALVAIKLVTIKNRKVLSALESSLD